MKNKFLAKLINKNSLKNNALVIIGTLSLASAWVISNYYKSSIESKMTEYYYFRYSIGTTFLSMKISEHHLSTLDSNSRFVDSINAYGNALTSKSQLLDLATVYLHDTTGKYYPKADNDIVMKELTQAISQWVIHKDLLALTDLNSQLSNKLTNLINKLEMDSIKYQDNLNSRLDYYDNLILFFVILGSILISIDKVIKYQKE